MSTYVAYVCTRTGLAGTALDLPLVFSLVLSLISRTQVLTVIGSIIADNATTEACAS